MKWDDENKCFVNDDEELNKSAGECAEFLISTICILAFAVFCFLFIAGF